MNQYAKIIPVRKDIGVIWDLFVKKPYRRKKYARYMVNKLIEQAKLNKMKELRVYTDNPHAIDLYTKLHFEIFMPVDEPVLTLQGLTCMRLPLSK